MFVWRVPGCVSSTPILVADDCLLYRRINSTEDSEILQQDLNNLQDWEQKWMMSFNPDKCEVVRVTAKQKNLFEAVYTIHGKPLNTVSSAKYLELTDTKLNYSEHVSNICKKPTLLGLSSTVTPEAVLGEQRRSQEFDLGGYIWVKETKQPHKFKVD